VFTFHVQAFIFVSLRNKADSTLLTCPLPNQVFPHRFQIWYTYCRRAESILNINILCCQNTINTSQSPQYWFSQDCITHIQYDIPLTFRLHFNVYIRFGTRRARRLNQCRTFALRRDWRGRTQYRVVPNPGVSKLIDNKIL
jgi:hypothetical protein